ncbi:MAG: hypothetical protein J0L77_08350 [Alphaproteobacteria bacterium]|nr:hypothetical protein [Alphaproteobacteria bacterium]
MSGQKQPQTPLDKGMSRPSTEKDRADALRENLKKRKIQATERQKDDHGKNASGQ